MTDDDAIAGLVRTFFSAFVPGAGLDDLRRVLIPRALIIRAGGEPAIYDVDSFLNPRRDLLASGRLTDFREWEVTGHTEIFGDMAQHTSRYAKSGTLDGIPFTGEGTKLFHFLRTPAAWQISAVSWQDAG